jgi:type II secretion system protein H
MVETLTSAASTELAFPARRLSGGLAGLAGRLRRPLRIAAGRLPARRECAGGERAGGERGFTLLEVIVVMIIVGVVAAMAIPSMQAGSRQAAVRRSVRAFISAARQASAEAVRTRKPAALIVWPDDGTFSVEGAKDRYELPGFAEFGEIVGGREAEGEDEILFDFYPTGSSAGGSVEITFDTGSRPQSYILVLDPLVSRVRIEDAS